MYCQVDSISKGSSLGPILAKILVGFYQKLLFDWFPETYIYLRYVDNTFTFFCSRNAALSFFQRLNNLHPSLTFAMDEKKDNELPFLDALVERCSFAYVTSIYRNLTFTGLYLSLDAYAPKSRKVNLIKCLTLRAIKICSDKIKSEFEQIKSLFLGNGYPEEVIVDTIKKLFISLRITSGHLPLLNAQVMFDFFELDFLASWLSIRFLPLSCAVIVQLWFEPSLQRELKFVLLIRMYSKSFNKAI